MKDRPQILFVTPTSSERETLGSLCEALPASIHFAENPLEAVHRLRSNFDCDVVFVGIDSPGDEHCLILQAAQERSPSPAVVLLSHIDDVGFYLECLRKGAFDYIPRPVDWREFRRIYEHALDYRSAQIVPLARAG